MKTNKILLSLTKLLLISTLTSCATFMHGPNQSIGIASNPSNAEIWIDNYYVGNTPLIVEMSRRDNHFVSITLPGYQTYEATFSRQVSGWIFGNIVFGGLIGIAVDAVTGSIYKLTPEQIQAELRDESRWYSKQTDESRIFVVLEPKDNWEKIGNLVTK